MSNQPDDVAGKFDPFFTYGIQVMPFVHVDDLPKGDPTKELGNALGDQFIYIVEMLRDPNRFPNQEINELLNLTWWLVNQRRVLTAMNARIRTLSFASNSACTVGFLAFPEDWLIQFNKNRILCTGGVVCTASQVRDFHNGKMHHTDESVIKRAHGYESEYYRTLSLLDGFEPNDYQQEVIRAYPDGLHSIRHLLYPRRQFTNFVS